MKLIPRSFLGDFFDDWMDYPLRRSVNKVNDSKLQEFKNYSIRTDIKENGSNYELDMDLPGYKKENIKIDLEDGYLTISASNSNETEENDSEGKYVHRERYFGSCTRSFYVGENVSYEDIKAKFDNGILHVVFPKDKPKEIEGKKYINIE